MLNEDKLTLIQCVAILHSETIYTPCQGEYHKLISDAIKGIKLPDTVSEGDERATLVYLKKYVDEIITGISKFDEKTMLTGLKIFSPFDTGAERAVRDLLKDVTVEEAKKTVDSLTIELYKVVNKSKLKRQLISSLSRVDERGISDEDIIAELQVALDNTRARKKKGRPASYVASVGTLAEGSIAGTMGRAVETLNGKSLRTGWQDMNRMLGLSNGVRPGECIVIPALPHNAKTTFSLSLYISMALFNKAEDFVPAGKKGLWLDISLENELEVNLPIIYRMIKEHHTGEAVDVRNIDAAEAEQYIRDKIRENGWDMMFERHTGSEFGITELRDTMEHYEAEGYHLMGVRMDYAGEAKMTGLGNGTNGSEVRDFYRRFKDLGTALLSEDVRRECVMISPHQLSPAAKAFKAMDPYTYVRNLPGKGYYDRCTTVDNVVDCELFIGIQDRTDGSYLEVQRGKHRTTVDTPVSHRYFVIPFNNIGTLPWDVLLDHKLTLASVNEGTMAHAANDLNLSWAA